MTLCLQRMVQLQVPLAKTKTTLAASDWVDVTLSFVSQLCIHGMLTADNCFLAAKRGWAVSPCPQRGWQDIYRRCWPGCSY
jgi:hypothetical protein